MAVKLTPAAGQLLDDYLSELRHRVVREAARAASPHGSAGTAETRAAIRRVTVADRFLPQPVFELVSALSRPPYAAAFLGLTILIGLAAATAVVVLGDLPFSPLSGSLLGACVGAVTTVGICVVLGTRQAVRERARTARIEIAEDFVRRLSQVESQARSIVGEHASLRETLNALVSQGLWAAEDVAAFGRLLRQRNALVHQDSLPPSESELLGLLLRTDQLARQLDK